MDLFEPWKIRIGQQDMSKLIECDHVSLELLLDPKAQGHGDHEGCQPVSTPYSLEVRDRYITPNVMWYLKKAYGYIPKEAPCVQSRAEIFGENRPWQVAAPAHESHVVAMFFTEDSPETGDLVLLDPRAHAGRGYPEEIRDYDFQPYCIRAKRGELYVFPSYLLQQAVVHPRGIARDRVVLYSEYFLGLD